MKMKIYQLDDYENDLGPAIYEGRFIELFLLFDHQMPSKKIKNNMNKIPDFRNNQYGNFKRGFAQKHIVFDGKENVGNISILSNPKLELDGLNYPIKTNPVSICQALGHFGLNPKFSKEVELDKKGARFVEFSTSIYPERTTRHLSLEDTKSSFKYRLNDQHFNAKIVERVGCLNFSDLEF